MILPLGPHGYLGPWSALACALAVGMLFGLFLERAGMGDPRRLMGVFYGRDMTVLKVMFTAILTTAIGLQYLTLFGRMDIARVVVLPTFLWGQVIGGLVFGVGFVMGGYCPGTGLIGAVTGRRDAMSFVAGAFIGTALWGRLFGVFAGIYEAGSRGVLTLGDCLGVTPGMAVLVVVLVALAAFRTATLVEEIVCARRGEVADGGVPPCAM